MKSLIKILCLSSLCLANQELSKKTILSFNPNISFFHDISYNKYDVNLDETSFPILNFDIMCNIPNGFGFLFGLGFVEQETTGIRPDDLDINENFVSTRKIQLNKFRIGATLNNHKKNFSYYSALNFSRITNIYEIDSVNIDEHEIDKEIKYSGGVSFGILIIPYQLQQLSGLTFQLGCNFDTMLGNGIELGIGYRI